MTGKTHLIIGLASGLALSHYIQPPTVTVTAAIVGASAIGSLLPDIDSPQSTINRLIPPLGLMTFFVNHRGILHSIFIPIAVIVLSFFVVPMMQYQTILIALSIGYLSHLVADAMTIQGIPLLSPIPFNIHLLPPFFRVRTGGLIEFIIMIGVVVSMVIGIANYFQVDIL